MDFPSYVPEGARNNATHFLGYYEPYLAECEVKLAEIEERISYWLLPDQDTYYAEIQLIELRQRKAEEKKHRDDLARDIASIKRLVHDARMKDAYKILINAFFDDEDSEQQRKMDGFFYAAWSANLCFSPYRERLKKAEGLRDEIAKTADNLSGLLDQIAETGVMCPSEFFYIPELLRNTDNRGRNFYIWQSVRGYALGDPPRRELSETEQAEMDITDNPKIVQIVFVDEKPDIDPVEQTRNALRYYWEKSPTLSALLKTVSKAAKEFSFKETGLIGAAISSQKQNTKTEYLRAFGNLLIEQHKLSLNKDIMKAMAIAANVVINSPDIDATYEDVRKALAKLGG